MFKKIEKAKIRRIFGKVKFGNIKIRKKLILTFILVTLISSIGGVVGYIVLANTMGQYSKTLVNYGFSQGDVGLCNTEFNNDLILLRDIIIQKDRTDMLKTQQKIVQSMAKLQQYLKRIKPEMVTDSEVKYYETIESSLDEFIPTQDQVVQMALSNNTSDAYSTLSQSVPLAKQVSASINSLVEEKTTFGKQISKDLSRYGTVAKTIIPCAIALSIFLSIIIALTISRGISKPISELVQVSQKMAQGDLSAKIEIKTKDEIGQLSAAFAETVEILNRYISDIKSKLAGVEKGDLTISKDIKYKGDFVQLIGSIEGIVQFMNCTIFKMWESSQQVANSSKQVSDGAQALAQGTVEQASSIEQLSASIAEISSQISGNSNHATKASSDVNRVSLEIETCNQSMQHMIEAMAKINDSSSQIGKIIKTIENIAFQTNILALNASVEAARAGNAGKGFAVVADEVRNLANQSSAAAKDTTALIQNSICEVESGNQIAEKTAQSLQRVVESAKVVSETVEHISKATVKQSDAIRQINAGIEQISGVVQTNSATAEESAAASAELSEQAQMMKALAEQFRLMPESEIN